MESKTHVSTGFSALAVGRASPGKGARRKTALEKEVRDRERKKEKCDSLAEKDEPTK